MVSEKEVKVLSCPKCETRMVKQPDIFALTSFSREPTGGVSFTVSDTVSTRLYVCPKCHYMEFYYERV